MSSASVEERRVGGRAGEHKLDGRAVAVDAPAVEPQCKQRALREERGEERAVGGAGGARRRAQRIGHGHELEGILARVRLGGRRPCALASKGVEQALASVQSIQLKRWLA